MQFTPLGMALTRCRDENNFLRAETQLLKKRVQDLESELARKQRIDVEQDEEGVKKLITEWFLPRYRPVWNRKRTSLVVGRKRFREEFINVLLKERGYTPWTAATKLYRTWFLPELMREDDRNRSLSKPFSFEVLPAELVHAPPERLDVVEELNESPKC